MSNHPGPLDASHQPSPEGRLDSWKEIAGYLRREVRTVQRWEKVAALPVHRLQIDKQGSVYAYRAELDAWYRDRRTQLESDSASKKRHFLFVFQSNRIQVLGATVVLAALALGGLYWSWKKPFSRVGPTPAKIKIVVLPFKNLSGDPEQEYFSDGMTEEMITELGRMQPDRLGVVARTSAMLYKNTGKDLSQICRELGVQYALEGSVFQSQNRARITAQLIQCSDQTHVWADSSERDLVNILSLQSTVAQSVAEQTRLVLDASARSRLSFQPPVNPEAYQAYLKGLFMWDQLAPDANRSAVQFFQSAIEKDPAYAKAHAALANCYVIAGLLGAEPPLQALSDARNAATKAVILDDRQAEPHAVLGHIAMEYDWDWVAAEREYRHALDLNQSLAVAHIGYWRLLLLLHRPDEASTELRAGQALDPISQTTAVATVEDLYFSRHYTESIAHAKELLRFHPDSMGIHAVLAEAYNQQGESAIAVEMHLKALELAGEQAPRIAALRAASRASGIRGFWKKKLQLDMSPGRGDSVRAYDVAYDYASLGDRDRAFEWLEKSLLARDGLVIEVSLQPIFDALRADSRFGELLRKMNLPQ